MEQTFLGMGAINNGNNGMGMTPRLVYGMQRTEVKKVVKLLFYDGLLVSWKQTVEKRQSLD